MNVNDQGIFSDIIYWKLGCNWGSYKPSFYNVLKNRNIVISHESKGRYNVGDLILIAEGHTILAITQIKSQPIPLNENDALVNELSQYHVNGFNNILYYDVEFYELPINEQFKFELQQGIVRVHKLPIKKKATQRWLDRNNTSKVDKRIMRLTWNTNNWEFPSGHHWSEKKQGKSEVAYENQYGFGHEEWLFNERFRIDGYQYGYIRGVNNLSVEVEKIEQITLYTIREDKQRCLVGNIYNVEIIEGVESEEKKINKLISLYKTEMIEELKKVNADFEHFKKDQLLPNVRFKWDDVDLFHQPMPVDFLDGAEFNRFQAYYLKQELILPIQQEFEKKLKFIFQHGKASNTGEYTKSSSKKETKVRRRHGEITDDLYDFLLSNGFNEVNISVEKTHVGGAIVDVVLKLDNSFDLFEVKTSNSALINIRQALGQIFEYALMDEEIKCNRLVIVGPAELRPQEKEYFARLKSLISIRIEYWEYKSDEKLIENKFIIE